MSLMEPVASTSNRFSPLAVDDGWQDTSPVQAEVSGGDLDKNTLGNDAGGDTGGSSVGDVMGGASSSARVVETVSSNTATGTAGTGEAVCNTVVNTSSDICGGSGDTSSVSTAGQHRSWADVVDDDTPVCTPVRTPVRSPVSTPVRTPVRTPVHMSMSAPHHTGMRRSIRTTSSTSMHKSGSAHTRVASCAPANTASCAPASAAGRAHTSAANYAPAHATPSPSKMDDDGFRVVTRRGRNSSRTAPLSGRSQNVNTHSTHDSWTVSSWKERRSRRYGDSEKIATVDKSTDSWRSHNESSCDDSRHQPDFGRIHNYEICSFNKLCPNPKCPKAHHKDRNIEKIIVDPNREYCIFALNGEECKFRDCRMEHDVTCPDSENCAQSCILKHPPGHDPKSVVCRKGLNCTSAKCLGVHPPGRELPICEFDPFCTRVGRGCDKRHSDENGKLRMLKGFCNFKTNGMECKHDPCVYENPSSYACQEGKNCKYLKQGKCGFSH